MELELQSGEWVGPGITLRSEPEQHWLRGKVSEPTETTMVWYNKHAIKKHTGVYKILMLDVTLGETYIAWQKEVEDGA